MDLQQEQLDQGNDTVRQQVFREQIEAHYRAIPGMIFAPTAGALFTAWVLWKAVNPYYLRIGLALVISIAVVRVIQYALFHRYFRRHQDRGVWKWSAIAVAFVSGCVWGSAVVFLYPPLDPTYENYLLVLFALIPIAPVAALANYIPTFFSYYIPCAAPFIVRLLLQGDRGSLTTAILLLMLTAATIAFAKMYYKNIYNSLTLQIVTRQQKDRLEKANKAKSIFLASASHDLRQPLHAMRLLTEAIEPHLTSKQGKYIHEKLLTTGETLYGLLDGLLDISKLDAGIVDIDRKHFPIATLCQKICSEFMPAAMEKNLRLSTVANSAIVFTDPVLLERIVRNLVSNAIRYTERGGVVVGCRRARGCYRLQVVDTGIGIARMDQNRIFEEFTQLHNAARNHYKGLGLGLAIVRRLAQLLELPLEVASSNGGSIFSLTIPSGRPSVVATSELEPSRHSGIRNFSGKTILIVDDNEEAREATAILVNSWGCSTITSQDHKDGIRQLENWRLLPDVILVDYWLDDGYSGLEAADALLKHFNTTIPVVIVTGDTSQDSLRAVESAGHHLCHKPLSANELHRVLSELTG